MIVPKWIVSATLALALAEAFSENSVYLKSPNFLNKLVTSSTLRWITAEKGNHPDTAVVGTVERVVNESARVNPFKGEGDSESDGTFERNVYICRASHSGIWIPGQLRIGRQACLISLHDNVHAYEKYEVLENTEGGARLAWVRWDKFNDVPVGAVAGDTFVARKLVKKDGDKTLGLKHLIGKLDDSNSFGKLSVITEDEKEEEVADGEVLTEIEPVRYELTGIKYVHAKKTVLKSPVSLGEAILANNQNMSGQIDTMIGYDDNTSVYWGQVKAMLKGLPTIIRTDSSVLEEFEWGITLRDSVKMLKKVEAFLEPDTAVNVTLKGNHTEIETPYVARLIAVYSDGANRARQIHGIRAEIQLQDVTPEFSPVYFTGNYSLVPTTTTTTTTTTTETTTTQETTESSTNVIPKDISSNEIDKKTENPNVNVMNDQGSHTKSNDNAASAQGVNGGIELNKGSFTTISMLILLYRIL